MVQEYERAVIFRLGRVVGGAKGPGMKDFYGKWTTLKFSFPTFVWLKALYILFKKYLSPSDQFYSHYISNFEYKSCHLNYIGMNFIFLLINSVAILHPQGLSLFWVRTVWFHIWYHTVWTQNGLSPFNCISLFFRHLSKNSPLARNCKS